MESKLELIRSHLYISAEVKRATVQDCIYDIYKASEAIIKCLKNGGKILLCGNGGSAADCQHMATELVGNFGNSIKRNGLPAIALTTDTSFITAYSNDNNFDHIFERQVITLGKSGDVLIVFSTSGNSMNVILAVESAMKLGIITIALTGAYGRLGKTSQIVIAVPSTITTFIQETHVSILHILCELVETELFSNGI